MKQRLEIKCREGTKWYPVPVKDLTGTRIIDYLTTTQQDIVACLFIDDQPVMYISNREDQVKKYREKGLSLAAADLEILFGKSDPLVALVDEVFGETKLQDVTIEEK